MRKTIICCDKCGAEIVGKPMQIIPEYSDRDDGSYEPYSGEEEELPLWIKRMLSKEFCEGCAQKIFDFALNTATIKINEKEPDREENGSGFAKIKKPVFRDGILVNGSSIWSDELFPYIGHEVDFEITNRLITVKDGEKVLFTREFPE